MAALLPAAVQAQVGRSCNPFNQCNNGFSCQPLVQKCYNSPRLKGQPCSAGYSCGDGLRCAPVIQKCEDVPEERVYPRDPPPDAVSPPPNAQAGPREVVRVQSINYPDRFFHVRESLAFIDAKPDNEDMRDMEFELVPGLADPNAVSFRSVTAPQSFLRQANLELRLDPTDGTTGFANDATFKLVPGLRGVGRSFESVALPGHFIRHASFRLYVNPNDGSELFLNDATFILHRITR